MKKLLFVLSIISLVQCDTSDSLNVSNPMKTKDLSSFKVKSVTSISSGNELYKKYITSSQIEAGILSLLNESGSELLEFENGNMLISVPYLREAGAGLTAFFRKDSDRATYIISKATADGNQSNGPNGVIRYYELNETELLTINLYRGYLSLKANVSLRTQGCMGSCTGNTLDWLAHDFPMNIVCMVFSPSCAAALVAYCVGECYF